jgi:hypothetical protein
MSAATTPAPTTDTTPDGPYYVWVGRSGYRNGKRGWATITGAKAAAHAIWQGHRGHVTLTVATFDGTVVWQEDV